MNYKLLKDIIKKSGKTYSDCAEALGISVQSFQRKINGDQILYLNEIEELGNFLNINDGEKTEIAFGKE